MLTTSQVLFHLLETEGPGPHPNQLSSLLGQDRGTGTKREGGNFWEWLEAPPRGNGRKWLCLAFGRLTSCSAVAPSLVQGAQDHWETSILAGQVGHQVQAKASVR